MKVNGTILALGLCATVLTGCGTQTSSVLAPNIANAPTGMRPQTACGGTNGVRAVPCPVTITDGYGVKVVIEDVHSHPRVYWALSKGPCGNVCKPSGIGNAYYLIQPGKKCGTATQDFRAYHYSFRYIGQAHLQVTNEYCP